MQICGKTRTRTQKHARAQTGTLTKCRVTDLDGLLVDLDAVRLVVRLDLRNGATATAPRVQHDSVFFTCAARQSDRGEKKSEKNNGPRRNDEGQGLNNEGQGLYVPFIHKMV